ncbi:hypothetical protein [Flavobacterium sp.]|uniref:hypothetical protein n=1 Tax=Flavobacterium sp. TaxID=239 RepID=UPI00260F1BF9|nr:hypothetical protein [Flavobacterium sp.]
MKNLLLIFVLVIIGFNAASAQKIIAFNKDAVIFTDEYFDSFPANTDLILGNFTPKLEHVRQIEFLIQQEYPEFKLHKKQFAGELSINEKRIKVTLIPSTTLKRYPKWRRKYINSIDNIFLRYAYFNINTGKLEFQKRSNIGG